jgi:tetratricopeptide (TPR) repeat protein
MRTNTSIIRNPGDCRSGQSFLLLLWAAVCMFLCGAGCSRKPNIDQSLSSADSYFNKRNFEAAKIQYINVLRAQQTNSHAMMRLGLIFFEQGQIQNAFPLLRQVRDTYPAEIPVREALALIYSLSGTNLWKPEVDAILQIQPTNQTAVMTLLRMSNTPEAVAELTNTIAALRSRSGNQAVFILAEGELAMRKGDKAAGIAAFRRGVETEPSSIFANLTLGGVLFSDGKTDEGLALLAKAAELSPPHGPARLRYAQALLSAGKTEEGIKVLDEINSKAPEVIPAWTTRAEVALAKREFKEARRLLDGALKPSPGDPQSLRVRARIDLAENKPADAVQALEAVTRWMPGSSDVQYQLGVANLMKNDRPRAIIHLREATRLDPGSIQASLLLADLEIQSGNSASAIGMLVGISQKAPENPQARMLLARAYRATGRLDDAIATLTAMAAKYPTNAIPPLQLGLVLRQKNRDKEARSAFESCLRIDPRNPMALEQLVQLEVKAGDRAAGMARIEARIRETPNDPLPWLIKSELLRTSGDTAGTEAALRKVLEILPDSQKALVGLAQLYITTGRNTEALAELERAVQKAPDNVSALTLIGMLQSEMGKSAEARAAYEKALKIQPDSPLVLNNLAYLLAEKLGDLGGAHEVATRARRTHPRSAIIADTLGWIEYRRNNFPEAVRLLIDAAEDLGENPEIQYHLGMAHYMMGHEEAALAALRQASAATTPFEGLPIAKAHLAVLETPAESTGPATIANLEKRRNESPSDLIALSRLAAAYAVSGDREKARETYETALKVSPNSPLLLSRFAGLQAQQFGATNRALELARQARQQAPDDPVVGHIAGKVATLAGDHAYAYSLLQDSAAKLPEDSEVNFDFAMAAYAVGRLDQATNRMAAIAKSAADPIAARARLFLDMASFSANPQPARLTPAISEALRTNSISLVTQFASARLAEARLETAQAQQGYESILAKYPSFLPAARQLALLLAELPGADAKAYDLNLRIRQELPRDEDIAAALGKLAYRRGDFRLSIQLLEEVTRRRANDGSAWFHLGLAHLGLKQTPNGKAALERALATDPDAKFVPEAKKLLSELKPNP